MINDKHRVYELYSSVCKNLIDRLFVQLACVFARWFVESNGSYESSRFLSALYRRYSLFERHPYCVQCVRYTDFVQYLEGATFDFFFLATVIALVSLSSRVGASAQEQATDLHHFFAEDIGLPGYYLRKYTRRALSVSLRSFSRCLSYNFIFLL